MWPNHQFPANLVTFAEEMLNGKLHFFVQLNLEHIFSVQYYNHKETSQLILKVKPLDWILYEGNIEH